MGLQGFVLFLLIVVPLVLWLSSGGGSKGSVPLEVFRQVASRYRGAWVLEEAGGRSDALHVPLNGARISVWIRFPPNSAWEIVWKAQLPARLGRFRVRGGIGNLFGGAAFGGRYIQIGAYPPFDAAYSVVCDDPTLMRRAWSTDCCAYALARLPRACIQNRHGDAADDDSDITIVDQVLVLDEHTVAAGIELIGMLAANDVYGVEALCRLDGSTFHRGDPPYAIVRGGVDIRVGPVHTPGGTVTRATCIAGLAHAVPDPAQLHSTGATFTCDGEQWHVTWPGIETCGERLDCAIALLRSMSRGPSLGAFR